MKFKYAQLIDAIDELRAMEAKLTMQKALVEGLKIQFLTQMEKVGTDTYKGPLGTVSVVKTIIPVISDWVALTDYITQNNAFDLIQKRVSSTAWRDRIESGATVPGVEEFPKSTLRIGA